VSILDIANKIIDLCGKSGTLKTVHIEPRIGEVKRLIADATRAKNLLGWNLNIALRRRFEVFCSMVQELWI